MCVFLLLSFPYRFLNPALEGNCQAPNLQGQETMRAFIHPKDKNLEVRKSLLYTSSVHFIAVTVEVKCLSECTYNKGLNSAFIMNCENCLIVLFDNGWNFFFIFNLISLTFHIVKMKDSTSRSQTPII